MKRRSDHHPTKGVPHSRRNPTCSSRSATYGDVAYSVVAMDYRNVSNPRLFEAYERFGNKRFGGGPLNTAVHNFESL